MNGTLENSIRNALNAAGYKYHCGNWIRLKGKGLDAISINSSSGGWINHRSGERGNYRVLAEKLGLGHIHAEYRDWQQEQGQINRPQQKPYDSQQRAKTLWARAVPAVKPKKPSHYTQEAWDVAQAPYAECREAVYDYLQSRGLAPLHWMQIIKIVPRLEPRYKHGEPANLDAEMAEQGADFYFLIPMRQLGASEAPAHICGVQRTYLSFPADKYDKARKIGRAMLGKKGVTTLTPPPGFLPVMLPAKGPVLGSGEGFETVASFVEKMRHPAVVCWDWSGLKKWAEMLQPTAESPTVAVLVDFDKSETGQRVSAAAVRKIRAQGGKSFYLLPPESIQPDDKGNRDWNDALRQGLDFAAEIVHAWHRSEQDMAKAPVAPDAPTLIKRGPRPAEVAQAIAKSVGRQDAYMQMETAVKEYLRKYRQFLEELAYWKSLTAEQKKVLKKPKLPPLLIKVTTGVGKSHLIRELIQSTDLPILILVLNHALAEEYAKAGALWYHGRAEPNFQPSNGAFYTEDEAARLRESTCFKFPVIKLVAEKNHVPSLTACRECEHGRKFMLEHYHPASQPYQDAQAWFKAHPQIHADAVTPCLWLSHQAKIRCARVVVTPYQSYSETLATWQNGDDAVPRLVIVDEIPELSREIRAHSGDMGLYVEKCAQSVEYVRKNPKDGEDSEKIAADLETAKGIFEDLGELLGRAITETTHVSDELAQRVQRLHVDWLPGATARWEKADVRYGHEPFAPLRMARALIQSIATRTAIIEKGRILVHEVTTLGDRIIKGAPTVLLDATPSPAVEYVVSNDGGQVVNAIAKQYVRITHFYQYLHGRTWKNREHQEQEMMRLMALREQMEQETGKTPATLTYMPHCELAGKIDDPLWGYWGRDDVGQDKWKGQNLFIFGGQIFSPETQASNYNSELLLRRLAGDRESPDWSKEIERNVEVVVGDRVVQAKAPLPADSILREWTLRDYGRRMAQAIGRARAVWATPDHPIHVWIVGGLPLSGLAEHGLEVSEYREERKNLNAVASQAAKEKVAVAVASLQAADKEPSYRSVNKWLTDRGLPEVRYSVWKEVMKASTTLNNTTHKGVDELLRALDSIARSADFCGCDIADVAKDRLAAPDLPKIHRIAALLILESAGQRPPDS
ncbi:toprim domain-containing protein [Acidithiobacillus caldus]|uniref:Toprim domain-containing protein n=1 Tax=Acidithiobacillus caldus TaxID=33059 RepID=A0A1E7YQW0_9PROT|nr:toprim domain-containing protein [Acidithiobacillus caldus]OFC38867.1 hypothetical protein BAE27_01115 [Acidithiobacillus caldus]OFC39019.1 hypothetical protein BAE29_08065 [Acidithiobacillus caldus]OFC39054.1 hypothetical protein BAE28_04375 [Acidithiobacillus caldus]